MILCDLFPPAFGPRMGYLCKYLQINGWNPVVITEDVAEYTFSFLAQQLQELKIDITYIRYYRKKGWIGKVEWGWAFVRDILYNYKDKRLCHIALQKMKQQRFDLIVCSTYRTFPMRAAARLARKKRLPLVIDLRDIIEQYTGNEFITHPLPKLFGLDKQIASVFRKSNLKIRNRILGQAAYVTTISPWHVAVLSAYNANTCLIYNGYDPELFYPDNRQADKFYITYTGRLLSAAMRDPELLFQALQRLADEGTITPESFRIRWYVDKKSEDIITVTASKYAGIAPYMGYYGYIPASEIPKTLNESAILLVLTNKATASGDPQDAMTELKKNDIQDEKSTFASNGPRGVMTTKLFESLAVGKPVLCVRGDEGCIEEVINQTRSGLSAHTAHEVYDFIKRHYMRWKAGLPYEDSSDREEIKKFSREAQAKQFMDMIRQVCT